MLRVLTSFATLALVSLSIPGSGLAAKWKVTLVKISAAATKATGEPWDADGSPPDIEGAFYIGTLAAETGVCKRSQTKQFTKHQDVYQIQTNWGTIVEAESLASVCVGANFWDSDIAFDDPIGHGAASLSDSLEPSFGQISLELAVEPLQATPPTETRVTLPALRAPRSDFLYRVKVMTARINGQKPDGLSWDEPSDPEAQREQQTKAFFKLGLKLMTGGLIPAMRGLGDLDRDTSSHTYLARTVSAPDPFIMLRWGEQLSFRTPTRYNTFGPRWDTTFLVPPEVLQKTSLTVEVSDDDDGKDEAIETEVLSGDDLLRRLQQSSVVHLQFGSVKDLVLQIEPVREAERPDQETFTLDVSKGWLDTGKNLTGGQIVQIRASGEHCMADGRCMDPGGDSGVVAYRSDTDQELVVHKGELAAAIGDVVLPIGRGAQIVAPTSGRLFLGVHEGSASGSLDVKVVVAYPLATSVPAPPTITPAVEVQGPTEVRDK